jgi:dienelactone hydrolase
LEAEPSQYPLAHPVGQPASEPLRPTSRPRIASSEGPGNQKAVFLAVGAVGAFLVIVVLMMVVVFSSDPGKNRRTAGSPALGSSGRSSGGSTSDSENTISAASKQRSAATAGAGVVDFQREPAVQFGAVRKLPCEVPCVQWKEVSVTGKIGAPGSAGKLWVYVPSGPHGPRSLGCVLIGPAGSRMVHGMELVLNDQAEHCPYVEKGFAVVAFEIDGALPNENPSNGQFRRAYDRFVAAAAGVVNARIALKYATSEMPEVDPNRVFVAGHSSAGTVALLCAEHVDGLAGCVAYAPCSDLEGFLAGFVSDVEEVLPNVRQYMVDGSPCTYSRRLRCPVMIFHAVDDNVVRLSESRRFVQLASSAGQSVALQPGTRGGHYKAMIVEGIPEAIKWMNRTQPSASPTAPSPASTLARPGTAPSAGTSPFSAMPAPSSMAANGTIRAYVRIKIVSYPSTGHPETIAREALRSLVWAEPDSIRIDRSNNELVIGVSVMQVNTNTARIALEKAGFVVAGAKFEPVRN